MWGKKTCRYVRDGLRLSGTGAAVFAEGLLGAVTSALGKVRYLNIYSGAGGGGLSKKAKKKYKKIAHAREYREAHTKKKYMRMLER